MANQFGKVSVGITATTGGLTAGLRRAGGELNKFSTVASKLGNINIATTFLAFERAASLAASTVSGLTRSLSGLVESSVSLGEEQSKSGVIFGKSADEVQKFARAASAIGLSESAALQAAGTFGNLFRAIGLTEQQSAGYSTTLVSLASDLASFNNTTVEEALQALGAGLRGESEPLRRYGVLLDDATLRQVAFEMGLVSTTKNALTPAQKAQAALHAIMMQTTLAQGDFTRTSSSLANQQRILQAEFENVRAQLGEGLQPAYKAVIDAIRNSIPQITAVANQFAAFVGGLDLSEVATAAVTSLTALAQTLTQITAGLAPIVASLLSPFFNGLVFIANNATGAAVGLGVVVAALATYRLAALAASVANVGLATSFRALLASTGVGVIVALIGVAAGALLEYALGETGGGSAQAANLGRDFGAELEASTANLTAQLEQSQSAIAAEMDQSASSSADSLENVSVATAIESSKAAEKISQRIGASAEKLNAIVVGSSEGEAFRNSVLRGADPRSQNGVDQQIARNTAQTAQGIQALPGAIGSAVAGSISNATIGV